MKRQKNLIGLFALAALIAMGVSSCKKYDDDIDQLRQEIADTKAALENALKAGKLITDVTPVTGGWDIVFSDNSKITVKNGESGFAPVIGIDSEGYWTVVTAEGAAPTRIKDASGEAVKAVASVPTPNEETKTWWIDGKDTEISYQGEGFSPYIDAESGNWMVYNNQTKAYEDSGVKAGVNFQEIKIEKGVLIIDGVATNAVGIPSVAYNDLNKTVIITVYDAAGNAVNYEFLQASDVMVMITSISAPVAKPLVAFEYGKANAGFEWTKAEKYKTNDLLLPNDKIVMPVIVNPAGATLDGCTVEIVDANEESFTIPVSKVTKGYDYDKYGFVELTTAGAPAKNGLWTLELGLTAENLAALNDAVNPGSPTSYLAVKVTKGEGENARVLYSGYQYSIKATKSTETIDLASSDGVPSPQTVQIGEPTDLLAALLTSHHKKAFRQDLTVKTDADKVKSLITIDGTTISTNLSDKAKLEGKTVEFEARVADFAGTISKQDISVTFRTAIPVEKVTLDNAAVTLRNNYTYGKNTVNSDTTFVSFQPVFDALGGDKDLWLANAKDFKVEIKTAKGDAVVAKGEMGSGTFPISFYEENITAEASKGVNPALAFDGSANAKIHYIGIMAYATQTKALPGSYVATITYTDKRTGMTTFEIEVPFTVANPAVDLTKLFVHTPALFDGQNVAIFGEQTSGTVTVDLSKLYSTITGSAGTDYAFAFDGKNPVNNKLSDPLSTTGNVTFTMTSANMYKKFAIDLYYNMFGNAANQVKVETILVTPKSLVKEGKMIQKETGKPGEEVPVPFEVTIGGAALNMSSVWEFADFNAVKQAIFDSSLGNEVSAVAVELTGDNTTLVTLAGPTSGDFTLTPQGTAQMVTDTAQVGVKVTITDKLGQKFIETLQLTVHKAK